MIFCYFRGIIRWNFLQTIKIWQNKFLLLCCVLGHRPSTKCHVTVQLQLSLEKIKICKKKHFNFFKSKNCKLESWQIAGSDSYYDYLRFCMANILKLHNYINWWKSKPKLPIFWNSTEANKRNVLNFMFVCEMRIIKRDSNQCHMRTSSWCFAFAMH